MTHIDPLTPILTSTVPKDSIITVSNHCNYFPFIFITPTFAPLVTAMRSCKRVHSMTKQLRSTELWSHSLLLFPIIRLFITGAWFVAFVTYTSCGSLMVPATNNTQLRHHLLTVSTLHGILTLSDASTYVD